MTGILLMAAAVVIAATALTLGTGARVEDERPPRWSRVRLMARNLASPPWRLLAVLPPGRVHERHVRARLGMPARHPEHCTRPGPAGEQRLLDGIQARTWPGNEWVDVLLYRDGG